jgi:general secretion pathway protein B
MSVILDALRKLDREKAARRAGTANIAAEILRPGLPRAARRLPLYLAIVALTAVAAAVITYGVVEYKFKPSGISDKASPLPPVSAKSLSPEPVNPPAVAPPAQPEPLNSGKPAAPTAVRAPSPPPPAKQVEPAASMPPPPQPVHEARDETKRVPPKVESPPESRTVPPSISSPPSADEKKNPQSVVSEKPNGAPGKTEQPAEKQTVAEPPATPPSLRLSAIVWHEEPSKRIAMINGMISTEGSVVEGVKVEEIHPDRVRLSYGGRVFEIPLK